MKLNEKIMDFFLLHLIYKHIMIDLKIVFFFFTQKAH